MQIEYYLEEDLKNKVDELLYYLLKPQEYLMDHRIRNL